MQLPKDMAAWDKMVKARTQLVVAAAFFGSLAVGQEMIEDPNCDTAWTDSVRLGYNPDYVKLWDIVILKGLLAHEVCHIALCHHLRRGNREHLLWNEACDYAVNTILIPAGFKLPDGALFDARFNGMAAEQIYDILKLERENGGKEGEGNDQEGGQDEDSDDSGGGEEDSEGEDGKPRYGDPGKCGEIRDAPSDTGELSESEIQEMEGQLKVAIAQAAQLQETLGGSMPGGVERLVKDMLDPLIPWQQVLLRFIHLNAKNDYSMKRPNWNFLGDGTYLPSMISDEIDLMVWIIDTSISQSNADIEACAAELSGVLAAFPTKLIVLYVDTQIQAIEEWTSQDLPIVPRPAGGGGTDFRPGFEWIEKQGLAPTVVVYLTDGECSNYPTEPSYPVLWIGTRRPFTPPFGEVVMARG